MISDINYTCLDSDDRKQLLAYLEHEIKREAVSESWKRWARRRIEALKKQFLTLFLPSPRAGVFYVYYSMCIVILKNKKVFENKS